MSAILFDPEAGRMRGRKQLSYGIWIICADFMTRPFYPYSSVGIFFRRMRIELYSHPRSVYLINHHDGLNRETPLKCIRSLLRHRQIGIGAGVDFKQTIFFSDAYCFAQ